MSRLATINVMGAAAFVALWRLGMFAGWPSIAHYEVLSLSVLALIFAAGVVNLAFGRVENAHHIADGLPIWGLCFTVLGIILAGAAVHSTSQDALIDMIKGIILALSNNLVGTLGMRWLHELAYWSGIEERKA